MLSKILTREDSGDYRTTDSLRSVALRAPIATSLGTDISMVTEKISGDRDEKQEKSS